ncbi:Uma2 family endonuclease [Streptomyces stramineus]
MSAADFEELARTAPEGVKLEFTKGKLEVKPVPDGDHDDIAMWLVEQCLRLRPDLWLYRERRLRVEDGGKGRSIPDGTLAPRKHFRGRQDEWPDPTDVLMTVEITPRDPDTDRRDRGEKRDGYAEARIPVYLRVDRRACTFTVYSEPQDGKYRNRRTHAYGDTVKLPHPVAITLETEELKDYLP